MSIMDKYSPKVAGIRDPRDPKKKNGMLHNWPRYLKFGGRGNETKLDMAPHESAGGPISDRGKGGRR